MILNPAATPPAITAAGIYDDTLVKTAEGWRFKKRATRSGLPAQTASR